MASPMPCDHHDAGGCVPEARSRARILAQLEAATALGDALAGVARAGVVRFESEGRAVHLVLDATELIPALQAWLAWIGVAPSGDDWHPAEAPAASYPDESSAPERTGAGTD